MLQIDRSSERLSHANILEVQEVLSTATKEAATAVGPFIGKGETVKNLADQAAVDAIAKVLSKNDVFGCRVVIGEGEKDKAPMFEHGSFIGSNHSNVYDMAIDPLEGTSLAVEAKEGAISIVALSDSGTMVEWLGVNYMKKKFVGPRAAKELSIVGDVRLDGNPEENLKLVAKSLGKKISDLTVAVLFRERNRDIFEAAHKVGANIMGLYHGDVIPAIMTCYEDSGIDMVYSSGGSPEGVIATAAVEILGGGSQLMWDPQSANPHEKDILREREILGRVLYPSNIVGDGNLFVSFTAVTPYRPASSESGTASGPIGWDSGYSFSKFRQKHTG